MLGSYSNGGLGAVDWGNIIGSAITATTDVKKAEIQAQSAEDIAKIQSATKSAPVIISGAKSTGGKGLMIAGLTAAGLLTVLLVFMVTRRKKRGK